MKFAHLLLAAVGCVTAAAQAQLVEQPSPQLSAKPQDNPAFDKGFQPYPRPYLRDEAPQLDPLVFKNYRADPKLRGGYQVAPNMAIETGYTYLSSRGAHYVDPNDPTGLANKSKGFATYAAAKVEAPLGDNLSAYGRLGVAYSERNDHEPPGTRIKDTDVGPYVGAGTQYKLSDKTSVSGQYERYGNSAKWGKDANASGAGAKLNVGF